MMYLPKASDNFFEIEFLLVWTPTKFPFMVLQIV